MFEIATKKKSKLRLALMGVSGAGKTYSALSIATGLGTKIAFIDTEEGSASKYSDRFKFLVKQVEKADVDTLISIIDYVNNADIEVLIIDSLSHAWQELLEENEKLAKTKYRGNTYSAWSESTPRQKKLIKAILRCKAHVICTMRSKIETAQEKNEQGRTVIRKLGTAVEQGKNIEYEFDMLIDISQDHIAHVTKDRTGKFQDALIEKPDAKFGKELKKWLDEGLDVSQVESATLGSNSEEVDDWNKEPEVIEELPKKQKISEGQVLRLKAIMSSEVDKETGLGYPLPRWTNEQAKDYTFNKYGVYSAKDLTVDIYDDVCRYFATHAGHFSDTKGQVKIAVDGVIK